MCVCAYLRISMQMYVLVIIHVYMCMTYMHRMCMYVYTYTEILKPNAYPTLMYTEKKNTRVWDKHIPFCFFWPNVCHELTEIYPKLIPRLKSENSKCPNTSWKKKTQTRLQKGSKFSQNPGPFTGCSSSSTEIALIGGGSYNSFTQKDKYLTRRWLKFQNRKATLVAVVTWSVTPKTAGFVVV